MPDKAGAGADRCVSVVIPAFNEEAAIGKQVREVEEALRASGWAFEILVVDDGSTDGTGAAADTLGVKVLRRERNGGYGTALKSGIAAAAYEWILITDADGTYPSAAIPELLSRTVRADMVVGARTGARVTIPAARRPAKWILRQYASLIVGRRIPDLNSGMRVMRRSYVERFRDLLPPGFSFTTTITLAMLRAGAQVEYVPIDYFRRTGESKITPMDFWRFLRLITRFCLRPPTAQR
jgi:glycosyltransferase involved in cell wall biosynthesis